MLNRKLTVKDVLEAVCKCNPVVGTIEEYNFDAEVSWIYVINKFIKQNVYKNRIWSKVLFHRRNNFHLITQYNWEFSYDIHPLIVFNIGWMTLCKFTEINIHQHTKIQLIWPYFSRWTLFYAAMNKLFNNFGNKMCICFSVACLQSEFM